MTESELDAKLKAGEVKQVKPATSLPNDPIEATEAIAAIQAWMRDYEPLLEQLRNSLGGILSPTIPTTPTLPDRIACRIHCLSSLSVPNNTLYTIPFDAVADIDTHGMHDAATNNSRITVPEDGIYAVQGAIWWGPSGGASSRALIIRKNSVSDIKSSYMPPMSIDNSLDVFSLVSLAAADFIELQAYQNSGSSLVAGNGPGYTTLSLFRVN